MKFKILFAALIPALGLATTLRGDDKDLSEASKVGILPHQKKTLSVPPDERNPFSVPVSDNNSPIVDSSTEEAQLRSIMRRMRLVGVTPGNQGLKVLMGGMILEQGHFLPDLLPGQTNRLLVSKISRKEIEITVVDEDGAEQQEKIRKEFDIDKDVNGIYPGGEGKSSLHPLDLVRLKDRTKMRHEQKAENNNTFISGSSSNP